MAEFQKFRVDNNAPDELPPDGCCDCQIHVFGSPERYPLRPGTAYTPFPDATIDVALEMHHVLGIQRGVIVQATVHGTDHRILYDALQLAGPSYRGIAIVNDQISDEELSRLHEAGVRGARFNFWRQLNIAPSHDEFRRSIKRISRFGWIVKVHAAGEEWLELEDLLKELECSFIIDHIGHVDLKQGVDQPVLAMFRRLVAAGNCWLMVSNAHRSSAYDSDWSDVTPVLQAIIETAPDRVIWATDWPHVQYRRPMPTDTALLEQLYRATPDKVIRRKVLSENPAFLFWSGA